MICLLDLMSSYGSPMALQWFSTLSTLGTRIRILRSSSKAPRASFVFSILQFPKPSESLKSIFSSWKSERNAWSPETLWPCKSQVFNVSPPYGLNIFFDCLGHCWPWTLKCAITQARSRKLNRRKWLKTTVITFCLCEKPSSAAWLKVDFSGSDSFGNLGIENEGCPGGLGWGSLDPNPRLPG